MPVIAPTYCPVPSEKFQDQKLYNLIERTDIMWINLLQEGPAAQQLATAKVLTAHWGPLARRKAEPSRLVPERSEINGNLKARQLRQFLRRLSPRGARPW